MRSTFAAMFISLLATTALAEPIASLTLDWNRDGISDTAILEPSATLDGRADLLLFQGTAEGSDLILTAADFARRPTHPNMLLQIVQGTAPNRLEVIETGTRIDPSFWWAKTRIRYDDGGFFVDGHEIRQIPPIYQDNDLRCVLDLTDKTMGGGDDAMSDIMPIDQGPIPLSDWTASTFADLLNETFQVCTPLATTFQSFVDTGNTIDDTISLDWNNDGYSDNLALFDSYANPSVLVFLGDGSGQTHLTWIARNLGLPRSMQAHLRMAPGRRDVVEVTTLGQDSDGLRIDTVTKLAMQTDGPVISGFGVWQSYGPGPRGIDCLWDFERGKQINIYTDNWFDDVAYPDPIPLSIWENQPLSDIIGECRP